MRVEHPPILCSETNLDDALRLCYGYDCEQIMTRPNDDGLPATGLPSIDRILPTLRLLGPQGFIIVSNYGLRGPEYFVRPEQLRSN